jgi:hypothetical protein
VNVTAVLAASAVLLSAGSVTRAQTVDRAPARFRLAVAGPAPLASGWVELAPAVSPFGLAVTEDGRVVYQLAITVHDLPPAGSLGSYATYEAWLATPDLAVVRALGTVRNDAPLKAQADWNKFTVVVSAEGAAVGARWRGAVVLSGRSPSSLMQSFAGHSFYNTGMPPE